MEKTKEQKRAEEHLREISSPRNTLGRSRIFVREVIVIVPAYQIIEEEILRAVFG